MEQVKNEVFVIVGDDWEPDEEFPSVIEATRFAEAHRKQLGSYFIEGRPPRPIPPATPEPDQRGTCSRCGRLVPNAEAHLPHATPHGEQCTPEPVNLLREALKSISAMCEDAARKRWPYQACVVRCREEADQALASVPVKAEAGEEHDELGDFVFTVANHNHANCAAEGLSDKDCLSMFQQDARKLLASKALAAGGGG